MTGSVSTLAGAHDRRPVEVIYESATTRVFRSGQAAASVVCKEHLGADAAQRLQRETEILTRLNGTSGVLGLAAGSHPAKVLALEDCSGEPLARLLRTGPLSLAALLAVAPQLARTLAEVHRAGVIHLDISPNNILLSPARQLFLIDFDLAALADQPRPITQGGKIAGTLAYVAPEQTGRTGRSVDQRADLYAAGATLYEMATGRPPFGGDDALQLIHDHLVREPVPPSQIDPHVPQGLSNIILRLLSKEPERRYQSAEGLLHDLQRLGAELASGHDGVFELCGRDFPAQFSAPAQLVGRDAESKLLAAALADAMHKSCRAVLIEGAAGVGKSALIHGLRPAVAAARGWFVHGKFDQYQKDTARAGALTQALCALGRLLLAEPSDELALLRQRILDGVGRGAGLLARLLPEFALLLGTQPDVPEVDPRQAELQLQQATVDLLGALASSERPLVIVLDDLQWAESASLRALERLMGEHQLRGVLLVSAFRSDEGGEGLELAPMLARWRRQAQPPVEISLSNLTQAGTAELIMQLLRLEADRAAELAFAVSTLTGGNPFDTVEMCNALRREGLLSLGEQGWQWDPAKVRRFVGRGNVVDLLAARIARLPAGSRELLQSMSCLGNAVECKLLCAATGLNESELQDRLRAPLADGLLLADSTGTDSVHFRHDRVQQAVMSGMDEAQRGRHQLAMARRLVTTPAHVADAAQQYLACVSQLTEREEKRRAAELFIASAQHLASMAAFLLAERYFAAAGALLAEFDNPAVAALRRSIDAGRHAALYSLGRLQESDVPYASIQARTVDPLDLVEPTCLQMRSLFVRERMDDALQLGLSVLAQLGLEIPLEFASTDTQRRLDALNEWVTQDSRPDDSKRTPIHDRRLLAQAKLLNRAAWVANYRPDSTAYVWLLLESQRLWSEHGPCADLVACLPRMCNMLIEARQDYRNGFATARHVLAVGEALGYELQTSEALSIFATSACHWFEPLETAVDHAEQAYEIVKARGDVSYACYIRGTSLGSQLDIAPNLDVCDARIEESLILCRLSGNVRAAALNMGARQLLRALREQTAEPDSRVEQFVDQATLMRIASSSPSVGHSYYVRLALRALLFGDMPALIRDAANAMSAMRTLPGQYTATHAYLFIALGRAWQVRQARRDAQTDRDTPLHLAELDDCRQWLADRATDQPRNFLHLLRLVEAEQAWALGNLWQAATTFDDALTEAEGRQRPWHRALIAERAGLFHLTAGLPHTGRQLLAQARDLYQAWGASAKVAQMLREHGFLQTPAGGQAPQSVGVVPHSMQSSGTVSAESLDLIGVLRASQALSSETSLARLTTRVTEVLAALSGATRVLVLSFSDDQWWLLAPTPGESPVPAAQAAQREWLPQSAFSYVERTAEALVVDDAVSDDRFARDPYFAGMPYCSLLGAPISSQGRVCGMLLLENRMGRAAFNAQRLDTVMLIAGQLAVSLANAQVYESLEQRVRLRTRELEQMQAQLVAAARRAGKAEIANNVLHNVGNVLNSINVSASIARRIINNSRTKGLARAIQLMTDHEHDLAQFMRKDARGENLLSYMKEAVAVLRTEQETAIGDLDRLTRSVDHISYLVATQQSNAGPSIVMETAQPQELIEEALRLSAEAITRCGVHVERQYEEVPAAAVDKERLLQILVNLIRNAAQAMEGIPEASRRLTLRSTHVLEENGGYRLRITAQDQGEGIAPENLTRLFAHGFTTRKNGHGFGLHSSALAAVEMGGRLTAHSDGLGRGAVFTLDLPMTLGETAAPKG